MLSRILIAISIAIFSVTVIEVGYLLLSNFAPQNKTLSNQNNPASSPSPSRQQLGSGAMVSSVLTNTFEGKITQIDNKSGNFDKIAYDTKIVISRNNKSTPFYLNREILSRTIVNKIESGKRVPILITELSVGDSVRIKTEWQLSQTNKYDKFIDGEVLKL